MKIKLRVQKKKIEMLRTHYKKLLRESVKYIKITNDLNITELFYGTISQNADWIKF